MSRFEAADFTANGPRTGQRDVRASLRHEDTLGIHWRKAPE